MTQSGTEQPENSILDRPVERVVVDLDEQGLAAVGLAALPDGKPAPIDLYLPVVNQETGAMEMTRICGRDEVFKHSWWEQLKQAGQQSVWVMNSDVGALAEYLERRLTTTFGDPSVTAMQTAALLRETAALSVRLFFIEDNRDPDQVEAAANMAKRTVGYFFRDEDVLHNVVVVLLSSTTVYSHSVNVCLLALAFGRGLGHDKDTLLTLGLGGLLHDVGMARVPKEILDKPDVLDEQERALVRKHPRWGHRILSRVNTIPYDVLNIVLNHHERPDGSGYPSGLSAAQIPYMARLIRIVDIYDALTSPRPQRKALPPKEATLTLLKETEDKLDKNLLGKFIRLHRQVFA